MSLTQSAHTAFGLKCVLLHIYSNYDYGICGLQFAPVIGLLAIILFPITSVG